ncbi:hypothetical protein AB0H71_07510 [Nocardia sp. NPDC050697]|uniref:hypothetical protein n=1 Tax=Nocardia sp. NPDC050697 TaxID=3155158 RepID=UPI0033FAE884
MSAPAGRRANRTATEILDYFGKCPRCGYPATAWLHTVVADGRTRREVVGVCDSPCGWTGPVRVTSMTGQGRARS